MCILLVDVILLSAQCPFLSTSTNQRQYDSKRLRNGRLAHKCTANPEACAVDTEHSLNTMDAPDPNTPRPAPEAEQSDELFPAERLTRAEKWWRDHYELLKQRGYLLRPRYQPDWSPSPNSGKPGLRWGHSDEFIGLPVCHKHLHEPLAETVNRIQM
jgi:hypothetical protein